MLITLVVMDYPQQSSPIASSSALSSPLTDLDTIDDNTDDASEGENSAVAVEYEPEERPPPPDQEEEAVDTKPSGSRVYSLQSLACEWISGPTPNPKDVSPININFIWNKRFTLDPKFHPRRSTTIKTFTLSMLVFCTVVLQSVD